MHVCFLFWFYFFNSKIFLQLQQKASIRVTEAVERKNQELLNAENFHSASHGSDMKNISNTNKNQYNTNSLVTENVVREKRKNTTGLQVFYSLEFFKF